MLDTLSNVKTRLGISGSDYDTFLNQQIALLSDVIEAYCRRKFITATYKQNFYKNENPSTARMELYHYPVKTLTLIKEDTFTLDPSLYRVHKATATITRTAGSFFYCADTEVVYSAGYDTCPTPVLAVLDALVSERYNKKISGVDLNFGSDVQRISIPGAISIDFDYTLANNDRKSSYGTIIGNYANVLDAWSSERATIGSGKLEYVEVVP